MPYMNLPPGNKSVRMSDGSAPYVADRAGGRVFVEDRHVRDINAVGGNGTAGLLHAGFREFGTRKAGRQCTGCGRIYYAWTTVCPRASCGAATEPEWPSAAVPAHE